MWCGGGGGGGGSGGAEQLPPNQLLAKYMVFLHGKGREAIKMIGIESSMKNHQIIGDEMMNS